MDTEATLVELEERFWRAAGDRERYEADLAPDAVHVFPGWGVAGRDRVLEGVAEAEPWTSFTLSDVRLVALGEDAAGLVYTARAQRGEAPSYAAAITSVYRRAGGGWQLVLHQQTPLSADAD